MKLNPFPEHMTHHNLVMHFGLCEMCCTSAKFVMQEGRQSAQQCSDLTLMYQQDPDSLLEYSPSSYSPLCC